jgi:hypothetical protein
LRVPPPRRVRQAFRICAIVVVGLLICAPALSAQALSALQGRVLDASGAVVTDAVVRVFNGSVSFDTAVRTDAEGRYRVFAIPAGTYAVLAEAGGFRPVRLEEFRLDVGRTIVHDFHLEPAGMAAEVTVVAEVPQIDKASATLGHVVSPEIIQNIPLNGRHFVDLTLLVPGSVAPSQAGFSSRPIRGLGTLAFNTAGNREEAASFIVNGVSTNNLTFGSLIFEPPIGSVDEFKADTSVFAAEYGHVSGAVVNIVTRSGSDKVRGEAFEYFRNDALDARNFFEFTTTKPHPFSRNQFGGSLGGPVWRGRTFYFAAYDGVRHRQGVDLNSLVLSDEQRASVTDPVIRQLLPLIPRANVITSTGTPRFVGSAPAVVDVDRWTADVRHNVADRDRLHLFIGSQYWRTREPTTQGNSIPGFGSQSQPDSSVLTVGHTHVFRGSTTNEARYGRTHVNGGTFTAAALNPVQFGIGNGVTRAIGLPQMIVAGDLNFGGPGSFPQGRFDTLHVLTDTFTHARGHHTIKTGAEYRHFINENFAEGTGTFNFPSVEAFMRATANSFNITLGERRSLIDQRAFGVFGQDQIAIGDRLRVDLGLRYEWHVTPVERGNRFIVFDRAAGSLIRVGVDIPWIYQQNNANVEPRVGVTWSLPGDGNTVLRAAYGHAVDQPVTTAVRDTASNPPYGVPLTATGAVALASALDATRPAGLSPSTVDRGYKNASLRAWNVNLQRQITAKLAVMGGYSGSHGSNLRISRNINQPAAGVRPFAAVAATSAIAPGAVLGNIPEVTSLGFSNYDAAWISLSRRDPRGLQLEASYTLSKSLDTNSLNSLGFAVQNANDIAAEYGPSDFDARHRFVLSATYALPFTGHVLTRGWRFAAVVQSQSGNPFNIVTSTATVNGTPNTVRPDVTGPIRIIGSVDQWFDPAPFVAVDGFGTLTRNALVGPAFNNTDVTVSKDARPGGLRVQFRADIFDLFNHPNFASPGTILGSPAFGRITRTRLPTGEAGSSRQIQLSLRLTF